MSGHGGYREGAGRPRGAKNKRTLKVEDTIQSLGCPFKGMSRVAKQAEQKGDLATAGRMYAELGRYLAPQRKAVDLNEDKSRKPNLLTMDELNELKEAILDGALEKKSEAGVEDILLN